MFGASWDGISSLTDLRKTSAAGVQISFGTIRADGGDDDNGVVVVVGAIPGTGAALLALTFGFGFCRRRAGSLPRRSPSGPSRSQGDLA